MYLQFFLTVLIGLSFTAITSAGNQIIEKRIDYNEGSLAPTNYVKNPSGKAGTLFTSASGTTITISSTTTTAPSSDFILDFDSASDAVDWQLIQPQYGSELEMQNCEAGLTYSGNAATYTLQVIQQDVNTLAENIISSVELGAASSTEVSLQVPCGSIYERKTGASDLSYVTTTVRVKSDNDGESIHAGRFYYGKNRKLGMVAQPTMYGGAKYAGTGSCSWSVTADSSLTVIPLDTDCPTPTLFGKGKASSTKIPAISFDTMPKGIYQVIIGGYFANNGSVNCAWGLSDGSSTYKMGSTPGSGAGDGSGTLSTFFEYTSSKSNVTLQMMASGRTASATCDIVNTAGTQGLNISVFRFPSSDEQVISTDQASWYIDANISGANIALSASTLSAYEAPNDSGLTLTKNDGSASVGISCSSTNDNSVGSTTCSSGNEESGLVFNVPFAGAYKACTAFSHNMDNGPSTDINATFQIVQTQNGSQTVYKEGNERIQNGYTQTGTESRVSTRICGNFNFASVGKKTLRLMREQVITGTPNAHQIFADGNTSNGQRDIHWEVYPIRSFQAPLYTNTVTTDLASNVPKQAWMDASLSACTITNTTGNFSLTSSNGTGDCTFAVTGFSELHGCIGSSDGSAPRMCTYSVSGNNSVRVERWSDAGAETNGTCHVFCYGLSQ